MNLCLVDESGNSSVQNSRNLIQPEVTVEALGEKGPQILEASQSEKNKLTNHKSNIFGEKNGFHCNLCDKTILKSFQWHHIKTVHEEKKYQCQQCDTLLTSRDDLRT